MHAHVIHMHVVSYVYDRHVGTVTNERVERGEEEEEEGESFIERDDLAGEVQRTSTIWSPLCYCPVSAFSRALAFVHWMRSASQPEIDSFRQLNEGPEEIMTRIFFAECRGERASKQKERWDLAQILPLSHPPLQDILTIQYTEQLL